MNYKMAYDVLASGILLLVMIAYMLNVQYTGLVILMVMYIMILGCMSKENEIMGKKIPCEFCGKLLGVRDVIAVIMPVLEDAVKTVTLKCSKCGREMEKSFEM